MAGLDTGGEEYDVPEICVVGNPTTWKLDLPPNHGKSANFLQLSSCRNYTGCRTLGKHYCNLKDPGIL